MRSLRLAAAGAVAAVAVAPSVAAPPAPLPTGSPSADCRARTAGLDLQTVTVEQLQAAMQRGRLTSRALTQAYLERIRAYDGPTNSVRVVSSRALEDAARLDRERRAGKVRGPLHGVPVLLKDNIGTTDVPTTAGSIALEGSIPRREAFVTSQLRAAGAVVLGKTNLSEFANWMSLGMPNGYSSLGGQVLNAYNGGDPSGSSSGSGVAGSMAFAAATLGSETSGSILSPSHVNGLVAVKPTLGLTSPVFQRAVDDLRAQGATLVDTRVVTHGGLVGLTEIAEIPNEFKASLNACLRDETRPGLKSGVRTLTDIRAYNARFPERVKYGQSLLDASDATPRNALLRQAPAAVTRPSSAAVIDAALRKDDLDAIVAPGPSYANVGAAAGYPTVMVPAGTLNDDTVARGLSFLGTAFDEADLLRYAAAYERATQRRVPPTVGNPDLLVGCSRSAAGRG